MLGAFFMSMICKICQKEYSKKSQFCSRRCYMIDYHNKNKNKKLEYERKYYRENLEKNQIKRKKYYEKNKKTILEKNKIYVQNNKEKVLFNASLRYYKIKISQKEYYLKKPKIYFKNLFLYLIIILFKYI